MMRHGVFKDMISMNGSRVFIGLNRIDIFL